MSLSKEKAIQNHVSEMELRQIIPNLPALTRDAKKRQKQKRRSLCVADVIIDKDGNLVVLIEDCGNNFYVYSFGEEGVGFYHLWKDEIDGIKYLGNLKEMFGGRDASRSSS